MFDPTPYVTALTGVKTAVEIVQGLLGMKFDPEMKTKLTALNSSIIDTQKALIDGQIQQSELLEENKVLKGTIASLEKWQAERERYKMEEIPPGVIVFTLKEDCTNGEPIHKLCANCFNSGKKSFLQFHHEIRGVTTWKCHGCNSVIATGTPTPRAVARSPQSGPEGWLAR